MNTMKEYTEWKNRAIAFAMIELHKKLGYTKSFTAKDFQKEVETFERLNNVILSTPFLEYKTSPHFRGGRFFTDLEKINRALKTLVTQGYLIRSPNRIMPTFTITDKNEF